MKYGLSLIWLAVKILTILVLIGCGSNYLVLYQNF